MAKGTSSPSLSRTPKSDKARERLWAAQSGLESLKHAEEVKKNPALMRDVKVLAKQEQAALAKVTGRNGRK